MRPGDSQGDGFGARERDLQDPLCLLLLVLFLQEQEKNEETVSKVNDHLHFQLKYSISFLKRICKTFDFFASVEYNISATRLDSRGRRPKGRG